jgi:hypothetical protein
MGAARKRTRSCSDSMHDPNCPRLGQRSGMSLEAIRARGAQSIGDGRREATGATIAADDATRLHIAHQYRHTHASTQFSVGGRRPLGIAVAH